MRISPAETPFRSIGLLEAELGPHPRFSPAAALEANVGLLERELDPARVRPIARPAPQKRKLEPALAAKVSALRS
jgi:hypothetical protein